MLLIISAASLSQQTKSSRVLARQDYLEKSKKQKTIAWICLGGGPVLILTGLVIAPNPKYYSVDYSALNTPAQNRQYHIYEALASTGLVSMLASIPLFLAAKRNKWEGMRLSFKNEMVPQLQNNSFANRPVPSLSLKISL